MGLFWRVGLRVSVVCIVAAFFFLVAHISVANDDLVPISAENAAQLRPLASLHSYDQEYPWATGTGALSTNSSIFVTFAEPRRVWDLKTFEAITLPTLSVTRADPDGRFVPIILNGVPSLFEIATRITYPLPTTDQSILIFSASGRWLLAGDTNLNHYTVLDVATRQVKTTMTSGHPRGRLIYPSFSPDERFVVFYPTEGTFVVRELETGKDKTYVTDKDTAAIFSPDGSLLFTSLAPVQSTYSPNEIHVWGGDAYGVFGTLKTGGYNTTWPPLISPDSAYFVTWTYRDVIVWGLEDGKLKERYTLENILSVLNISPDGRWLTVYDWDRNILIVDLATGTIHTTLDKKTYNFDTLVFNQDSSLVFTANYDHLIQVWQWDGAALTELMSLPGDNFLLTADETTLITEFEAGLYLAYGIPTAQRPAQPIVVTGRILDRINVRANPSPDAEKIALATPGQVLVAGRQGNYVYVPKWGGWVPNGQPYLELALDFPFEWLPELESPNDFTPLATATATLTPLPTATPVIVPTRTPLPTLTPGPIPTVALPTSAALTATPAVLTDAQVIGPENVDQIRLLTTIGDGAADTSADGSKLYLRVWDSTTVMNYDVFDTLTLAREPYFSAKDLVYTELYRLDIANHLLVTEDEGTVSIIDTLTGKSLGEVFFKESDSSSAQSLSAVHWNDDATLVIVAANKMIKVLNTNPAYERCTLPPEVDPYGGGTSFSEDSKFVLSWDFDDHSTSLYDTATCALIEVIPPAPTPMVPGAKPVDAYSSVAFSADGRLKAIINAAQSSHNSHVLHILDTATSQELTAFEVNGITALAFSPDSRLLAFGVPLRILDLQTGTITKIEGSYQLSSVYFTADGTTLVAQENSFVMIFGIPSALRPAWEPVHGRIRSEGVTLRSGPSSRAENIGYASGDVIIAGRDNDMLYLPELKGWIRGDEQYVDLGDLEFRDLPPLATSENTP